MSKILRKCLSLGLAVMLLASLSLNGILTVSADNKTGDGLAAYAMRAYNEGWVYSWGGASPGAVDCSGLIYSYVEGGERTTEGMLNASPESGYVSNGVPDIPGIGLWQPGHVGVYVGNGMAVDARDEISNVCYQSVATKSWVMWFKVDGVSYDTYSSVTNDNQSNEDSDSSDIQTNSDTYEPEYLSEGSDGSEVEAAESEDDSLTDIGGENVNIPTDDGEEYETDSVNEDTVSDDSFTQQLEEQTSDEDEVFDETDTYENDETNMSNEVVFTYGDSGDGVSNIQYILLNLGYYHSDITGEYDEKTFNTVEFFQLDNDLSATGSVNEETLNALFIEFAKKNSQTDNSADSDSQPIETAADEEEFQNEHLFYSSGDVLTDEDTSETAADTSDNEETTVSDLYSDEIESTETDTNTDSEISDITPDTDTSSEISDSDTDTESTVIAAANTDTDETTDTDTASATVSGTVKSGGTNTASSTAAGNAAKSPKTGDPLVMSVQSAVDYVENYINTTLVLVILGISCIVIFFAGTVHYWNVSMEKRRQRARKATTVSAFRRGSM